MKGSIRKFLLINLLLTMMVATVLTALGNYYLDSRDIRNHLDILLGQSSFYIEALLGHDLYHRDLDKLQSDIYQAPKNSRHAFSRIGYANPLYHQQKYQFQIWSDDGRLLLRSQDAPTQNLSSGKNGFADIKINHTNWRTFATYNKDLHLHVIVAEEYGMETFLANRIAVDDIVILLLVFPLAAALIWIIVGRGLDSIYRVTHEVSHRAPNYLDPVNAQSVPREIKPLVIELNRLFLRLHQAIEREKRFAGDAAHELRTPLAALKTQAQVALRAESAEEREKLLHNVIFGVDRCTHIVQQLLTLSRLVPESNTLADACEIDLNKLAAEIVAQLAPLALDKDIDIELLCDQGATNIVQGNITALSILIRNLVDNAIRYTPEKGRISVTIFRNTSNHVGLKVVDNGPGIPAELRVRVFERFFRVLGNKSPGSGLGLAIVQQIASLHNAQLRLGTAVSGKGLEVEVIFPGLVQPT